MTKTATWTERVRSYADAQRERRKQWIDRQYPGPGRRLDERERTLRDRYSTVGYSFALVAMTAIFLTLWLVTAALPTALLAWNLPDDDPEDLAGVGDTPQTVAATNRRTVI